MVRGFWYLAAMATKILKLFARNTYGINPPLKVCSRLDLSSICLQVAEILLIEIVARGQWTKEVSSYKPPRSLDSGAPKTSVFALNFLNESFLYTYV